jgi:hypothetical protein
MAVNVPSTNPIPILYGEGRAARTRNEGLPTDLGGTFYVQYGPQQAYATLASKSSLLYVNAAAIGTLVTGASGVQPYAVGPLSNGSSLIPTAGALGYSGNWNTTPYIGSQLVNGFPVGGFPGSVIRGKFWGTYGATGTPTIATEVGVIQNNAGNSYPYTALSASTALTLGAVSAQAWEANFDIVVNNNLTTTTAVGSGFTGTVNTNSSGVVTGINVTATGSGYIGIPTLAISGAGSPTVNAILIPVLNSSGGIASVLVQTGVAGYTASLFSGGLVAATSTQGSVYARGNLILGGAAGAAATVLEFAPASTNLDTTQPYWIDLRTTFSVSAAANTQVVTGGYLEFLN